MEQNQILSFCLFKEIQTSDGYNITIEGVVKINAAKIDDEKVLQILTNIYKNYFSMLSLHDTFGVLETNHLQRLKENVKNELNNSGYEMTELIISAVNIFDEQPVIQEIDILPELEGSGKKKKGILSKLLGRN